MAMAPALTSDMSDGEGDGNLLIKSEDGRDQFLQELLQRRDKSPARHLQKLVDFDEEHAAAILKQWIRQGESA
jgi:flagellar M-ring protein FliF